MVFLKSSITEGGSVVSKMECRSMISSISEVKLAQGQDDKSIPIGSIYGIYLPTFS